MRYRGPANGLGGRCIDLQGVLLGLIHKSTRRSAWFELAVAPTALALRAPPIRTLRHDFTGADADAIGEGVQGLGVASLLNMLHHSRGNRRLYLIDSAAKFDGIFRT